MNVSVSSNSSETEILSTPSYIYLWVTIINAVVFILGFVGNILVIFVVLRFKDMKTSTNFCFVNLSISDLLTLSICQTSALTELFAHDRWLLGDALCKYGSYLKNLHIYPVYNFKRYKYKKFMPQLLFCFIPHNIHNFYQYSFCISRFLVLLNLEA